MSAELVDTRPDAWKTAAACRGTDPELWYPGRGQDTKHAKAICADCPVRAECLQAGLREYFGIWAGLSERERRRLRRTRRVERT